MLGVLMMGMVMGCGDKDDDKDDVSIKWPQEFKTVNNERFKKDLNATRPFIIFDFLGSSFKDKMTYYFASTSSVEFELIERRGKKMEVKVINGNDTYTNATEYILCTNYTLENGVLTFTGGNIPDISNITWYLSY